MMFFSIFTAKISDDLFPIFPFSSQISRIFAMLNVLYDPFHIRKNTISENNSFMTPFLLCSYFRAHPTTLYFSKYWGDGCMGRPPPQTLGVLSPPVLLGLRPCQQRKEHAN